MMKGLIRSALAQLGYRINRIDVEQPFDPYPPREQGASYRTFYGYANPLYMPWLVDGAFREVERSADGFAFSAPEMKGNRYLLFQLVCQASRLQGDLIEIGVHQGYSSHIIAATLESLMAKEKKLFSIDSFSGFPNLDEFDDHINFHKGGHANTDYESVKRSLSTHRCGIQVVKGFAPEAFEEVDASARFSLAHIDVDLHQSTWDCLAYVYPRMSEGAFILVDDYGFSMCPGARKAVDDFFADKEEVPLALPTGQALVVKLQRRQA